MGFKSFAEKTTFHFEPGITAIVGPNGCGKSNIFDSIRWVLGEQSEKALRSSKMEDVVFNGTEDTSSLGFAEVSLTFSNEKKFLPIDYSEVTVTRRLFRSGESEYLINKTPARLKDVLDLFYGTGIGAESYSLVEQGKVDLILSSRPQDRRLIFDEAAGITKYKSNKRETLRKLEDTQENLVRINDIISEVKRQINSLERQKIKAEKYKEIFERLKVTELRKASGEIQKSRDGKEIVDKKILDLEERRSSVEEKIESNSLVLQEVYRELDSKESEINSLREDVIFSENRISNNNQITSLNKERIEELNQRILELSEDKKLISERISKDRFSIEEKNKVIEDLKSLLSERNSQLKDREKNLSEIEENIKKAQREIPEFKKRIFEVISEVTPLKNQANGIEIEIQNLLARKRRLEVEREKIEQERLSSVAKKDSLIKEINSFNSQSEELCSLNKNRKSQLEDKKSEISSILKRIEDLEKEKLEYISQKEFLKELKLRCEEMPLRQEAIILLKERLESSSNVILTKEENIEEISEDLKKNFLDFNFKVNCQIRPVYQDESKLEERIKDIEENSKIISKEKEEKEREAERIEKEIEGTQNLIQKIEIERVNLEGQKNRIEEEITKLDSERELVNLELDQTKRDLEGLRKRESELQGAINIKESQAKDLENGLEEDRNKISLESQQRQDILITLTQYETQINSLKDRILSEEGTIQILSDSYSKNCQDLEKVEREKEEDSKKISELHQQIKGLDSEKEALEGKKEEFRKLLELRQSEYLKLKEAIKEKESESLQYNRVREDLKTQVYQLNSEIQRIEFEERSIRERIQQMYRIEVIEIREERDLEGVNLEIESLKKRLDSFGEVSMGAISEYDELKMRYEFLIQQRDDLFQAKDSLELAIKKINRITRKMFSETFREVSLKFKEYFRQLFGGGDAQLFLSDESEPLESGIEIVCRPPGKKLQNILLLSGGEKTLTAIALLFAIFKVRPSPFCVLDEVDAALDEVNIDRFSQLLKEFSLNSQFIVITHNKRTIANSDIMYGITMERSGISKVVSVKFAKEEEVLV